MIKKNQYLRLLKERKKDEIYAEYPDIKRLPHNVQMTVRTLISGDFVSRDENVLVFGKPGTGKTHFVSALGYKLISQGKSSLSEPSIAITTLSSIDFILLSFCNY